MITGKTRSFGNDEVVQVDGGEKIQSAAAEISLIRADRVG